MKWELYQSMTKKQKEEYDFRFRQNPIMLNINGLMSSIVIFILSISIFLFIAYLAIADPNMIAFRDKVQNIFRLVGQLVLATIFVNIGYVLWAFSLLFIRYYSEKRWKKRNNITR
jgi:uncharacterized membrane protein